MSLPLGQWGSLVMNEWPSKQLPGQEAETGREGESQAQLRTYSLMDSQAPSRTFQNKAQGPTLSQPPYRSGPELFLDPQALL